VIRRRVLVVLAGLTAGMLGSRLVRAADPAQRVVRLGFVHTQSPATATRGVSALWDRLRELGYIDGQNLVIEARWADGRIERLPAIMTELLGQKLDILVAATTQAAIAAKDATSTVPIVGVAMGEPLRTGLATNLARPGGNLTGLSVGWTEGMVGKWLELLQETVPWLSTVAVIEDPGTPVAQGMAQELAGLAHARRLKLRLIEVREPAGLEHAFEQARRNAQALLVLPSPVISARRGQVTALAARYRLPTIYPLRDYVDAGGLMAYGPDLAVQFRRGAEYVDKILKGAKPGDLAIEQPTNFELVVNLQTAKALGIIIPESILLRADEMIR
jgi:putative tryptophan/tyrosine transport system substrate-binding protein